MPRLRTPWNTEHQYRMVSNYWGSGVPLVFRGVPFSFFFVLFAFTLFAILKLLQLHPKFFLDFIFKFFHVIPVTYYIFKAPVNRAFNSLYVFQFL